MFAARLLAAVCCGMAGAGPRSSFTRVCCCGWLAHALRRAKFERAPREAMADALDWLHSQPGSVAGYLTRAGLMPEEQEELRLLLLRQPDTTPAGSDAAGTPARGKL